MNRAQTGWLFVAAQAVVLVGLVVAPGGDLWSVPGWLGAAGMAAIVAGLATIGLASLRLGPALTPTPVPTEAGRLVTTGLYRWVRHPIYSGVLLVVVGIAIRSGGGLKLVVALAAVAFFNVKAGWEEQRLSETYPDYPSYAAATPRFVPRPWRRA